MRKKYPNLEFEIKNCTQDTYTSGKYTFQVFCKTTEIDFLIYRLSFLTTDSYAVTYANLSTEKMLCTFFGKEFCETQIKSIQWLNLYEEGSTGYKFREVDISRLPCTVSDIQGIYKIELFANDTDGVFQTIRSIAEKLNNTENSCEKISFEWVQNEYAIVLDTDMFMLNHASDEELLAFLSYLGDTKQSDGNITVSYISRTKHAVFLPDEAKTSQIIPEFEDHFSTTETAQQ